MNPLENAVVACESRLNKLLDQYERSLDAERAIDAVDAEKSQMKTFDRKDANLLIAELNAKGVDTHDLTDALAQDGDVGQAFDRGLTKLRSQVAMSTTDKLQLQLASEDLQNGVATASDASANAFKTSMQIIGNLKA